MLNLFSPEITDFASTVSYRTNVISKLLFVFACVTFCAGPLTFAQERDSLDPTQMNTYRQQAERDDAEAEFKLG